MPLAEARAARDWNESVPVGSVVVMTLDDGSEHAATAMSEAWLLGGHTAVVMVSGIGGAYRLSRCRKASA